MPDQSTIEKFPEALRGRLAQPDDPDYDETRAICNSRIQKHPYFIAQCAESNLIIGVDSDPANIRRLTMARIRESQRR